MDQIGLQYHLVILINKYAYNHKHTFTYFCSDIYPAVDRVVSDRKAAHFASMNSEFIALHTGGVVPWDGSPTELLRVLWVARSALLKAVLLSK